MKTKSKFNYIAWASAILIFVLMSLFFPFIIARSRLNRTIADMKKDGLPVTPREYADKYYKPIPEEENGAAVFDEAFDLHVPMSDDKKLIIAGLAPDPCYDQKISPLLLPPAQAYIKDNSDLLKVMGGLKKYKLMRFKLDWDDGYGMELGPLNKFRDTMRIFAIKSELLIHQNKPREAAALIKEMFHFNKFVSQSPYIIGQFVFYACEATTVSSLNRCINTLSFNSAKLKEFEQECDKQEALVKKEYPKMWQSEMSATLDLVDLKVFNEQSSFIYDKGNHYEKILNKCHQMFYYYSGIYFNEINANVTASIAILKVPVDVYSKRISKLEKIRDDCIKEQKWRYIVGEPSIIVPVKTLSVTARLRCAKTACAVERYRLKHGKLPKDLKQLVPGFLKEVPVDPFDGNELRYFHGNFKLQYEEPLPPPVKKVGAEEDIWQDPFKNEPEKKTSVVEKNGFYIYSIGENLSDDSTLPIVERQRKDIMFIVVNKNK